MQAWRRACYGRETTIVTSLLTHNVTVNCFEPLLGTSAQLTMLFDVWRLPRLSAVFLLWQVRLIAAVVLRRST